MTATAGLEVRANHVSKVYSKRGGESAEAIRDFSCEVEPGSFVSLIGPSGCGKSTFLLLAAGLVGKSGGQLSVGGQEVDGPLHNIGMVFQQPWLLDWLTIFDNVMLQIKGRKMDKKQYVHRANELLDAVGLSDFKKSYPRELSGGMQQRAAIVRGLIHQPPLILMDEPFGALDALTRDQMTLDLQDLWLQQRTTILFVTHSIQEAVFLSDQILVFSPRPSVVERTIQVDLPRPRRLSMREDDGFLKYVRDIEQVFLARGVLREH